MFVSNDVARHAPSFHTRSPPVPGAQGTIHRSPVAASVASATSCSDRHPTCPAIRPVGSTAVLPVGQLVNSDHTDPGQTHITHSVYESDAQASALAQPPGDTSYSQEASIYAAPASIYSQPAPASIYSESTPASIYAQEPSSAASPAATPNQLAHAVGLPDAVPPTHHQPSAFGFVTEEHNEAGAETAASQSTAEAECNEAAIRMACVDGAQKQSAEKTMYGSAASGAVAARAVSQVESATVTETAERSVIFFLRRICFLHACIGSLHSRIVSWKVTWCISLCK